MVTRASDNPYPSLLFAEHVDPSNPAAGTQRLFVDTDHVLKLIDSAGTVTTFIGGAAVTDATISTSDVTTNNASTSKHGWLKKLDNNAAHFMDGTGAWSTPTGTAGLTEYDYVQVTSGNISITATTEGTANTVVTANAKAYDGSTVAVVEFFCPFGAPPAGNVNLIFVLYDDTGGGAASIGKWGQITGADSTNTDRKPVHLSRRLTPSNATHTFSVRAYVDSGTGTVNNGAGGSGNYMPLFIRQVK